MAVPPPASYKELYPSSSTTRRRAGVISLFAAVVVAFLIINLQLFLDFDILSGMICQCKTPFIDPSIDNVLPDQL